MSDTSRSNGDILLQLVMIIRNRKKASATQSYTRQLLDAGPNRCAKKFGEEATEAVIAAVAETPDALCSEAADVLYHLLVMLESRGVDYEDVLEELASRMGLSGLAEKAAR